MRFGSLLIQKESRRGLLPITYLLTYLLTYVLTYLLTYTYFNHVACSVSLQPTAQVDARSVALQSCTKRFFSQDEYIRQRYACSLAVHCGLALGLQHGMTC